MGDRRTGHLAVVTGSAPGNGPGIAKAMMVVVVGIILAVAARARAQPAPADPAATPPPPTDATATAPPPAVVEANPLAEAQLEQVRKEIAAAPKLFEFNGYLRSGIRHQRQGRDQDRVPGTRRVQQVPPRQRDRDLRRVRARHELDQSRSQRYVVQDRGQAGDRRAAQLHVRRPQRDRDPRGLRRGRPRDRLAPGDDVLGGPAVLSPARRPHHRLLLQRHERLRRRISGPQDRRDDQAIDRLPGRLRSPGDGGDAGRRPADQEHDRHPGVRHPARARQPRAVADPHDRGRRDPARRHRARRGSTAGSAAACSTSCR